MQDWLAGETGGQYLTAILWTVGALALLVIALLVARMLRRGTTGFGGHGRDHQPRLALGDSIEIDNQRRLILVRRDDVEHLILTGGPSDVVVEQGIGRSPAPVRREPPAPVVADQPVRRPAAVVVPTPAPVRPAEEPRPAAARAEPALDVAPRPVPEPEPARVTPAALQPVPRREEKVHEEPQPAPAAFQPRPAVSPVHAVAPVAAEPVHVAPQPQAQVSALARGPEEDDVVEFPQTDAARQRRQAEGRRDSSLEDEMSRLLEDISDERR